MIGKSPNYINTWQWDNFEFISLPCAVLRQSSDKHLFKVLMSACPNNIQELGLVSIMTFTMQNDVKRMKNFNKSKG